MRSTRDPSTLEFSSPRPRTRGGRIEHVSQSAPLRFAVAVLVVWLVVAALGVALWSAFTGDQMMDDGAQTAGRVLATVLLVVFLYRLGWLEPSGITRSGPRRAWLVVALAVGYLVPAYVWGLFGQSGLEALPRAWDGFSRELPTEISVGIAEEFLFRGVLLLVLVRAWGTSRRGILRAVLVTSVMFGLVHATPALAGEDLGHVAANLFGTIVSAGWWAALVLTYRTVWPGVVIHTLTNAAALAVAEIAQESSLGAWGSLRVDLLELPWLVFGVWLLMNERRLSVDANPGPVQESVTPGLYGFSVMSGNTEPRDEVSEAGRGTTTSAFGVGRRENHDASAFYARFSPPELSDDDRLGPLDLELPDPPCIVGDARHMTAVPDRSVALVVTSPPYFVGKEYEQAVTGKGEVAGPQIPRSYVEYLEMLRDVFAECKRTLEPGGRIAVNVANLGRKPYRSLSADVMRILQDDLGLLLRGEIIWQKAEGASGSVAWGSFNKATNPVLRDVTERVIVASKGRFDRARSRQQREKDGYPFENTMPVDEFMEATLDVWRIDAESARRVQHPAPFPVELPRRLIELYTFEDDLILDPFLGSGTTLVAAARTGRRGVGYDLDPGYIETARARYRAEKQRYRRQREQETAHQERFALELPPEATAEERADHFQRRASREGKKAQDLARQVLEEVGFEVIDEAYKLPKSGVHFNFRVVDSKGDREFLVDVSGAFTTARPGLLRTDTLWKTLGRAHVLKSLDEEARLLIVTSNLPRPGSDGDKALHAVGPGNVWDAIEMFDAGGVNRLEAYAQGNPEQLAGFWTEEELAARRDEQLARYYDTDG